MVENDNFVVSHMHAEDANYVMRAYQRHDCYASAPLIDIPLNYSSRNNPYIAGLDPYYNVFLI